MFSNSEDEDAFDEDENAYCASEMHIGIYYTYYFSICLNIISMFELIPDGNYNAVWSVFCCLLSVAPVVIFVSCLCIISMLKMTLYIMITSIQSLK